MQNKQTNKNSESGKKDKQKKNENLTQSQGPLQNSS